jgi:hypothetical protein
MLIEGTRIALILVTGVTIGVIGFGGPLIVRWMGPGFEAGVVPLYVLAMAGIVLVGQGPLGNILLGTGRHRLVAFVSLGEAVANLALSVMLVRRFGMLGVAIGTAVPIALANLFILLPAACRQVHVPLTTFLRLILAAPVTGAVPAIVACVMLRVWYPPASLPAILGEGAIAGLVYLTAVCAFGFDRDVRALRVTAPYAGVNAGRAGTGGGGGIVMTRPPNVSVIIATYNRAALLDECLAHLHTQRFLPGDEAIVVDNGSSDDTAAIVARHQGVWTAPLRLLHEPRPGKSHAIARALADASGDILVFTDDDVNVGAGWLDAIRDAMADPGIALAGGPVVPRWESTVPQWIRCARDRHLRLGAPIALLDYGDRSVDLGSRTLLGANPRSAARCSPWSAASPRIWPSSAARCSRARTTNCVAVCSRQGSEPCMSPTPSSTTGCRRSAPASRIFCSGFSGPASRTRSWTAVARRRTPVPSAAFRSISFGGSHRHPRACWPR